MAGVKRAARITEILAIIAFLLALTWCAIPHPVRYKTKAIEAEVKQNLHTIQLAVERYAVDHDSAYPAYLVGGEARWSAAVDTKKKSGAFSGQADCPDLMQAADPLLRAGYLNAYPRNPFVHDGRSLHRQQLTLPLDSPGGDPLRNSADTGRQYGTRFGSYCMNMGQVLGARQLLFGEIAASTGVPALTCFTFVSPPELPVGVDAAYPCWDKWDGKRSVTLLPGNFTYSAAVETKLQPPSGETAPPSQTDNALATPWDYILTAFGGVETKGRDVLDHEGNPYKLSSYGSYRYGNPNGIQDGVIMLLHGSY